MDQVVRPHTFHIPVMGTGFTIDTPLKVARYGIASVVSLVDDVLIEQMRRRISADEGQACVPIADHEPDARARRITEYLDLLDGLVERQIARVREARFVAGSEIVRYFELLPPSPLKDLYHRMASALDPGVRGKLQADLRRLVVPGAIDVNIMTKPDRDHDRQGRPFPRHGSDALSALRGFVNSRLRSSVVLSAGLNRRLFAYLAEFADFFPDERGEMRKRIILKVNDFRSAQVQGNLLARLGLHVSEYRVESGLNCGGHAFGGKGRLLGPILAEFQRERGQLAESLRAVREKALLGLGRDSGLAPAPARVTVQGGIGTAAEDALLRRRYGVDGTGWGSPFLLVPEVVNIDADSLARLAEAGEQDIQLSDASPLGVPFWSLRTSASETARRRRIALGDPGSRCPKGYLAANTEFTARPICTASRAFQKRKLAEIALAAPTAAERERQEAAVLAKACICHDLAGGATGPRGIDAEARTAVCCGPNTAYFQRPASLDEMVDHIYGRRELPLAAHRPHMLLKELSLHVDRLRDRIRQAAITAGDGQPTGIGESLENLRQGIAHYQDLARGLAAETRKAFLAQLERLHREVEGLVPVAVARS